MNETKGKSPIILPCKHKLNLETISPFIILNFLWDAADELHPKYSNTCIYEVFQQKNLVDITYTITCRGCDECITKRVIINPVDRDIIHEEINLRVRDTMRNHDAFSCYYIKKVLPAEKEEDDTELTPEFGIFFFPFAEEA